MPATLGSVTKNIIEYLESGKLHLEFEANGTIRYGAHVKIEAAGTVIEAADGDDVLDIIGFSIHDAVDGEKITVVCRGHAVVWGEAAAASLDCGPVELGAFNATTLYREYAAVSGADNAAKMAQWIGVNLTQGTSDGDVVKVLLI